MALCAHALLDTVIALDPLADLPRTGWLLRGIVPCESIAAHSFGVAVVSMHLVDMVRAGGTAVDGEKTLRMALIHDAPEARLGDIPMPVKSADLDAVLGVVEATIAAQVLPEGTLLLWHEFEAGVSVESRIVRAADKIHMMVKAWIYESHRGASVNEFWAPAVNTRDLDAVREVFEALYHRAGRPLPTFRTG